MVYVHDIVDDVRRGRPTLFSILRTYDNTIFAFSGRCSSSGTDKRSLFRVFRTHFNLLSLGKLSFRLLCNYWVVCFVCVIISVVSIHIYIFALALDCSATSLNILLPIEQIIRFDLDLV